MSAWGTNSGGPSAWGTQVEEEEASGGILGPPPAAPSAALGGADAFPTLGEAGKVSKKDKRKKGQAVSLAEFQTGASSARGSTFVPSAARQAPPSYEVDVKSLPTGPRERSAEEADRSGGLGGAFTRGGYGRGRDDDEFPERAPREDDGPSRADMADDWGKDRKFVPGGSSDRGGGFASRGFESSRADNEGTWGRSRASSRDDQDDSRPSSRGFEDRGDYAGPSRADTEDRWGANRSFVPSAAPSRGEANGDRWGSRRSSSPPPPAGPSSAGSRPRLALKPRTLPLPDLPPARSAASSESGASQAAAEPENFSVPVSAPVKRSNPFGAARPREDVLKEQGRDSTPPASDKGDTDRPQDVEELQTRIAELRARIESSKPAAASVATSEQGTDQEKPSTEAGSEPNGVSTSERAADESKSAASSPSDKLSADQEELRQLEEDLARALKVNDDKPATRGAGRW